MTAPASAPETGAGPRSTVDLAVGALLVIIGLVAGAMWLFPDTEPYGPLAVGIALLVLFALTRLYGFAVPAGIVTGVGVGVVAVAQADVAGGWFLISLAAGFAAVWPLGYVAKPALHSAWPLIPAGILTAVGLVSLTGWEDELPLGQFLGSALLVLIGVAMILRARSART